MAKEKSREGRNGFASILTQLATSYYSLNGGIVPRVGLDETWTANQVNSNEYFVTAKILIVGDADFASAGIVNVAQPDFNKICPGGEAQFTVLLNTETALPKNQCAENLSR